MFVSFSMCAAHEWVETAGLGKVRYADTEYATWTGKFHLTFFFNQNSYAVLNQS